MASIRKPIMLNETGQAIANTLNTIKNNIVYVKGDKGDTGNNGSNYVITNEDYDEIADITKPKVVTQIQPQINEIELIAKGANQSLSYSNYSAMITAFNSLANNVYNVGQNVLIITLEVPDLWISGIESTSSTYTYTTDEAFKTALATNGYVQVGYYKLSALETQKVDLTDYVKNTNYATWEVGGTVKVTSSNGITVDSTGQIATFKASNIEIDGKTNNYKSIVPSNLDYAVSSIVGHHVTLTQAQYDALETKVSDTYYYIVEE